MTEHPTDIELERYAQGALAVDDLLRVDDHLALCPACRRRTLDAADGSRRLAAAVRAVRQDVIAFTPRRRVPRVARWAGVAAVAATAVFAVNIIWGTRTVRVTEPPPITSAPRAARAEPAPAQSTLTAAERALVERATAEGQLPRPAALDVVRSTAGVLMGAPARAAAFGPIAPRGVVVDTDRPALAWSAAGPGARYRVSVFDDAFNLVESSGWQNATGWQVSRPLARGTSYSWQIVARTGDTTITAPAPPQPEARFLVTTGLQNSELAAMRKRAGDSHVARAVLLAQAGVLDEAERELSLASAENPDSSAVKRLQASLSELRR